MPLVTRERWNNKRWTATVCARGSSHVLWGVPASVSIHEELAVQKTADLDGDSVALIGSGEVGQYYDLAGGGRLVWRHVERKDQPHPLSPWEENPGELDHLAEGGARLSCLLLSSVPGKHAWKHRLTLPAGVKLYRQDALTKDEIDAGDVRPNAVVGSYAVYDATGCKIGHILRPCALSEDRSKRVWGSIAIVDGVSLVRFDPKALAELGKNATVYGLDTFGYTSVGASVSGGAPNEMSGYGAWSPAADGTAESVAIYTSNGAGSSATLGIYAGTSAAGALVADTGGGTIIVGWTTQNLDSPTAVYAASSYWLAMNNNTSYGASMHYDLVSGFNEAHKTSTYAVGTLDNPFGTPTLTRSNREGSCYVTYTPASSGIARSKIGRTLADKSPLLGGLVG